jgi:hypothetical protein
MTITDTLAMILSLHEYRSSIAYDGDQGLARSVDLLTLASAKGLEFDLVAKAVHPTAVIHWCDSGGVHDVRSCQWWHDPVGRFRRLLSACRAARLRMLMVPSPKLRERDKPRWARWQRNGSHMAPPAACTRLAPRG